EQQSPATGGNEVLNPEERHETSENASNITDDNPSPTIQPLSISTRFQSGALFPIRGAISDLISASAKSVGAKVEVTEEKKQAEQEKAEKARRTEKIDLNRPIPTGELAWNLRDKI
ncbi:unnamed protein product, partial [marine sediment metagenome]